MQLKEKTKKQQERETTNKNELKAEKAHARENHTNLMRPDQSSFLNAVDW